jgi:hypothetical protein
MILIDHRNGIDRYEDAIRVLGEFRDSIDSEKDNDLYVTCNLAIRAMNNAIPAYPNKLKRKTNTREYTSRRCPDCGCEIEIYDEQLNFCDNCGKAIDWGVLRYLGEDRGYIKGMEIGYHSMHGRNSYTIELSQPDVVDKVDNLGDLVIMYRNWVDDKGYGHKTFYKSIYFPDSRDRKSGVLYENIGRAKIWFKSMLIMRRREIEDGENQEGYSW